jgi:hypothetical protein
MVHIESLQQDLCIKIFASSSEYLLHKILGACGGACRVRTLLSRQFCKYITRDTAFIRVCACAAESIGTDSSHPSADMSLFNSGEKDGASAGIHVQRLPLSLSIIHITQL